jgi:hypothetical protein
MTRKFGNPYCLFLFFLMALIAVAPARAQQGQYHVNYAPFHLATMKSDGGVATYYPLKAITGDLLQLRDEDGSVFTFTLDADTVFCMGSSKVSDWTYLRKLGKKATITVLTNDFTDKKALVVWDRGPSISSSGGSTVFALPPICK